MKISGLFAGIGGLEEGFRRAGHQTVQLCEIDKVARAVLKDHFQLPRIESDIRALKRLARCDVVVAGFPCQDLSQAGTTKGLKGKSSGLVREVFRLIEATRPKPSWLVLENVPFMLKLAEGRAMHELASMIESVGWRWAYRTVDSRGFGLAQRRRRVIVVASRDGDPNQVLFADDHPSWKSSLPRSGKAYGFYWTEGNTGLGWAVDAIPTLKGGSAVAIPSPPAVWLPAQGAFGTPSIGDAERLQGLPSGWTRAAMFEDHGARHRWRLVGNAVSVPVAKWVGSRIEKPGSVACEVSGPLDPSGKWPDAACGHRGARYKVVASEAPLAQELGSLFTSLRDDIKPLSYRAASGFARRLEQSSLNADGTFRGQLSSYVARARAESA